MSEGGVLAGANVLIVDDAPANLDLLRDILQPAGCRIYFATSGEMALKIAADCSPDVVLLDVMMPGIDGFETCRRLKRIASLKEIPVVFVTAKTDVSDLAEGFSAGGVDYITKPVRPLELTTRVRTHVTIRRLIASQQQHLADIEHARRELQELNATKDKFLSNIGRDLLATVAEIVRTGDALREAVVAPGVGDQGARTLVDELNRSAEHVGRLLENILGRPRVQLGPKLDLLGARITDRDLRYLLESLDDLRFLSLADTGISDEGMEYITQLYALEELHLDNTAITNSSLARLRELPRLRILDLKDTRITDEGLARLGGLANLRGLYLTRTPITDAGLAHLGELTNLETLILWDTKITDKGLRYVEPLRQLRELVLWGTQVSEEGVRAIRRALPRCDVSTGLFD